MTIRAVLCYRRSVARARKNGSPFGFSSIGNVALVRIGHFWVRRSAVAFGAFALCATASLAASVPLPPERPAQLLHNGPQGNGSIPNDATNGTAASQVSAPCKGLDHNKWDNCTGTFQIENLGEYSGEIRNHRPEGAGAFKALDGSLYQGEFRNGVPAGKGRFISAKGGVYIGEFADGLANGEGSEVAADGTRYIGSYSSGMRDGKGHIIYPDGREYEGDFKSDVIEGYGSYNFPNGDSYTGVFYGGEPTERGIYRFANGDRYVGTFKDFKLSGQGVLTFALGHKFIGAFVDGQPKGPGVLYASDSTLIFEGDFLGFDSVERARSDYQAKSLTASAQVLSVKAADTQSGLDAKSIPNPPSRDSDPNVPTSNTDGAGPADQTSAIIVSNVSVSPLPADGNARGAEPDQSHVKDVAQNTNQSSHIDAAPQAQDPKTVTTIALPNAATDVKSTSTAPVAPVAAAQDTSAPSQSAVSPRAGSPLPPLQCERGGDLLVSFISCKIMEPQVEISDIYFSETSCKSGSTYLAEYDQMRTSEWYNILHRLKAYFYLRPFDFRGRHRFREDVHFLVSGCNLPGNFTIRVNGADWTWPLRGPPILTSGQVQTSN